MGASGSDRRQADRYPKRVWVDVQVQRERTRVQAGDVSRHGLFLEMPKTPEPGRVVLLTIHLPGGPFEAMATVARTVDHGGMTKPGMGVKFYCLGTESKARWDRFISDLGDEVVAAVERPSSGAATFLVQLPTIEAMRSFFVRHVATDKLVYMSPPLRRLGADVLVVLVHPQTGDELSLRGVVADLDPDRPLRMGVRFEEPGVVAKKRFQAFLDRAAATITEQREQQRVASLDEDGSLQYAYVSPKLAAAQAAAAGDDPHDDQPVVILGEPIDEPEIERVVDKQSLFDFDWTAEGDETT